MAPRVDRVGAAREHGDRGAPSVEAPLVGGRVDPECQTAYHHDPGGAQAPPKGMGHLRSVGRGVTSPDDRDRGCDAEAFEGEVTTRPEQDARRIVQVAEPGRKAWVVATDREDVRREEPFARSPAVEGGQELARPVGRASARCGDQLLVGKREETRGRACRGDRAAGRYRPRGERRGRPGAGRRGTPPAVTPWTSCGDPLPIIKSICERLLDVGPAGRGRAHRDRRACARRAARGHAAPTRACESRGPTSATSPLPRPPPASASAPVHASLQAPACPRAAPAVAPATPAPSRPPPRRGVARPRPTSSSGGTVDLADEIETVEQRTVRRRR